MARDVLLLTTSTDGSRVLREALTESGMSVHVVSSVADAVRVVRENPVGLALLEASDHDSRARAREEIAQLRPECRVAIVQGFEHAKSLGGIFHLGASDYIVDGRDFARLVAERADGPVDGENNPAQCSTLLQALDVVVALQEAADPFFVGYTSRVVRLVDAVARQMRLPEATRTGIVVATLLRDLGKAAVPKDVLHHPDRFTREQREQLERHVHWSVRLLEHIDFPGKVVSIIRHHHERYDGTGYPDGLKGRQIPLGSRIIAAAEAFTAMVSPRPHRAGQAHGDSVAELVASAGTQLDPEVVEALVEVLKTDPAASPSLQPRTVLLVDSDGEIRTLLKMKLVQEGYRVVEVHPPVTTAVPIESLAPDLVLYDASDGGAEALRFLESLRQHDDGQSVPFALLTVGHDRSLTRRAFRYGVDDLIDKMSELEDIVARIGNILTREEARRRTAAAPIPSGISGELDNLPLQEIVQILCMGEKTASVRITHGERMGALWFENGALVHAECGSTEGEEAFAALVAWPKGTFLIRHGEDAPRVSIESDPMVLLLEHCRVTDETSAIVDAALGSRTDADAPSEAAQ